MWKRKHIPLIIAASVSTILIVALLALGVPQIVLTNAYLLIGLLGILAVAIIASESLAMQYRLLTLHPGEDRYSVKCLHWRHRLTMWIAIWLLFYLLFLSEFVFLGTLTLGLLPFWLLVFLFIALIISLL